MTEVDRDRASAAFAMEKLDQATISLLFERNALFAEPAISPSSASPTLAKTATLVHVLNEIVHFGLRERATDIHIEPLEVFSRIRFRIDGALRDILTFPATLPRAIVSRLKIISGLNIPESRFP